MKTTLDIDAELLARARRHAANTGQTLRDVIEDGLRRVLSSRELIYGPDGVAGDRRAG